MVYYEVTVFTGNYEDANTFNDVFIKLVGVNGESERTMLKNDEEISPFIQGKESRFTVSCHHSLNQLVLIELDKQGNDVCPVDSWFLDKVEVKSEEERTYTFPIYSWITDSEGHYFIEGTVQKRPSQRVPQRVQMENGEIVRIQCEMYSFSLLDHLISSFWQGKEKEQKEKYCWQVYKEGLPHCMKAKDTSSLPPEVRFSFRKDIEFYFTAIIGLVEIGLKHLANNPVNWTGIDEISSVFYCKTTEISEHVRKHWMDDAFFGYQYLNGVNPMMIRRCSAMPSNFPVTDDMVFLHGRSLAEEMEKGNMFLCDYKILDGLNANTINGKKQYLMAPLVLLHKTPDDKLKPIAIQLKQTPAEDNPIFVPTDSEYDWLLAKSFVRSADFNEHQLNVHLLRTHLLAEVFAVSLLRNVPAGHPLYKLLVPHTRYTLHINIMARESLISDVGAFTTYAASGGEAMITVLQRSLSSLTYRSLCIHDDIADRGLESLPNFYYRDDGLRLWDIIHSFVQRILTEYFYPSDAAVKNDPELQSWIGDIFEHGFLSNQESGIPQSFSTVDELVKFVTMVIFTCSAQHSAVNAGQYDYGGFMPNTPISLQLPPPTRKGDANEKTLLDTLPAVNVTAHGMATLWLLSKPSTDFVGLGEEREKYFTEKTYRKLIKDFQEDLRKLSEGIKIRNETLKIPYTYMDPAQMEKSVAL